MSRASVRAVSLIDLFVGLFLAPIVLLTVAALYWLACGIFWVILKAKALKDVISHDLWVVIVFVIFSIALLLYDIYTEGF